MLSVFLHVNPKNDGKPQVFSPGVLLLTIVLFTNFTFCYLIQNCSLSSCILIQKMIENYKCFRQAFLLSAILHYHIPWGVKHTKLEKTFQGTISLKHIWVGQFRSSCSLFDCLLTMRTNNLMKQLKKTQHFPNSVRRKRIKGQTWINLSLYEKIFVLISAWSQKVSCLFCNFEI